MQRGLRPRRARRRLRRDGARHRRERHRQGARRARAPSSGASAGGPLRRRSTAPRSRRRSSRASCSATSRRVHRRQGAAHAASSSRRNGGTLFLDEIGEMPLALQPKLLRALQERVVRPLGGAAEMPVDVRIVAATNRDLESAIEEGALPRGPLLPRSTSSDVDLPPLRARARRRAAPRAALPRRFAERSGKTVTRTRGAGRGRSSSRTRGRATCASCRTASSARSRSRASRRSPSTICPRRSATTSRSHVVVAADDPTELVTMEEVERRYIRACWRRCREQDRGGAHPRLRSQDALPKARAARDRSHEDFVGSIPSRSIIL